MVARESALKGSCLIVGCDDSFYYVKKMFYGFNTIILALIIVLLALVGIRALMHRTTGRILKWVLRIAIVLGTSLLITEVIFDLF